MEFREKRVPWFAALVVICTICHCVKSKTEYSEPEMKTIRELRELVPEIVAQDDYYNDDSFLIRWLKARNMDLNTAHRMIQEAFEWRKENEIDAIVDQVVYNFPTPPYTFQGSDKENRPIVFFTSTTVDLRKLIVSGQRSAAVRLFDQMLERGLTKIKNLQNTTTLMSNGDKVNQFTAVMDMHGFNLRQHVCLQCLGVYLEWFTHLEKYYPDYVRYVVVVNMNRIAVPVLEAVKPILSEPSRNALQVFGPNKQEWIKFLFSIIDEDQLPYRFGGTAKNL